MKNENIDTNSSSNYTSFIMNTYTFRVIIEPDENNTFHGYVPLLPGCHTWGETIEETKINAREAILCHIQGLIMDNEPVPQETEIIELIQTISDAEWVKEQPVLIPA
ncbi:MAG TPA: hypothetical protein DEP08_05155 [Candidatus Jacksonbacteria bacterium]|nr:hypothetical protein [Candidatus Jacksonbacteria bacterium]